MLDKADDRSLHFPDVAVAELGFVLLRSYRMPAELVADTLRAVAMHRAIDVPHAAIWLEVADDIEAGQSLVDAYLMRTAAAIGAPEILTFDAKLKQRGGV